MFKVINLKGSAMRRVILMVFVVLVNTGCAWQTAAMKVGQDTYQTSANASPMRGGASGAREMALSNANQKCESMGKQIEVVETKSEYAFPANGLVTVTFKCM